MAFTEIELKKIDKIVGAFCKERTPEGLEDQLMVCYRVQNQDVLIYERRPRWNNPQEFTDSAVAKLKFVRTANIWQLYWQRANSKWVSYTPYPANKELKVLVKEIDKDQFGCFFG